MTDNEGNLKLFVITLFTKLIIIVGTILSDPDGQPYFTSLDGFVAKGFLCFFTNISN